MKRQGFRLRPGMTPARNRVWPVLLALSAAALVAEAQFTFPEPPVIPGVWSPKMDTGAVYRIETRDETTEMEIQIGPEEASGGQAGQWAEIATVGKPRAMVFRVLLAPENGMLRELKRVMQPEGQKPMEIPPFGRPLIQKVDFRKDATQTRSESVTVPAGTFTAQRWKSKDGETEVWLAENAGPWGVVKAVSKGTTITLQRVTGKTPSKIRGAPRKFDGDEFHKHFLNP